MKLKGKVSQHSGTRADVQILLKSGVEFQECCAEAVLQQVPDLSILIRTGINIFEIKLKTEKMLKKIIA